MPFFIRPIINGMVSKVREAYIDPQLKLHLDYLEGELEQDTWFAGQEFSAADIQMSFPIEAAGTSGGRLLPRLQEFLQRIHERPAYQRALEKGGDFNLLG